MPASPSSSADALFVIGLSCTTGAPWLTEILDTGGLDHSGLGPVYEPRTKSRANRDPPGQAGRPSEARDSANLGGIARSGALRTHVIRTYRYQMTIHDSQ